MRALLWVRSVRSLAWARSLEEAWACLVLKQPLLAGRSLLGLFRLRQRASRVDGRFVRAIKQALLRLARWAIAP